MNFGREIHMDESLVYTFSWGNSYGPMVLKVLLKFPPTLALVHGWLFPECFCINLGDRLFPLEPPKTSFGDRKSLSIAKNQLKPSQEFSEQFGPSFTK